ncbi:MAG: hypothetical protein RBR07_00010 [Arcobacteraceae bacterium]|nr:hypothetical protein [Arcobacteraceae bacterium]
MINFILLFVAIATMINLCVSLYDPNTLIQFLDNNSTNNYLDKWAIRGQIGDILAGHGTVIAFLLLIYNIRQQAESLLRFQDSLNLQKQSLKSQNEALNLSIREYKNQVIEFQTMNTQNKVYKLIDRIELYMDSLEYTIISIDTKNEEVKQGVLKLNNDISAFSLHDQNKKHTNFSIDIKYEQISRLFDKYLVLKKIITNLDNKTYDYLNSEFEIIKNQIETWEMQQLMILTFLTYKFNVLIGYDYISFLEKFHSKSKIEDNIAKYLLGKLREINLMQTIIEPEKKLKDEIKLFIDNQYNFNDYLRDDYKVLKFILNMNVNIVDVHR